MADSRTSFVGFGPEHNREGKRQPNCEKTAGKMVFPIPSVRSRLPDYIQSEAFCFVLSLRQISPRLQSVRDRLLPDYAPHRS